MFSRRQIKPILQVEIRVRSLFYWTSSISATLVLQCFASIPVCVSFTLKSFKRCKKLSILLSVFLISFLFHSSAVCPKVPEGVFGICSEECGADKKCDDGQLCCSNGCGHVCKKGKLIRCWVMYRSHMRGMIVTVDLMIAEKKDRKHNTRWTHFCINCL